MLRQSVITVHEQIKLYRNLNRHLPSPGKAGYMLPLNILVIINYIKMPLQTFVCKGITLVLKRLLFSYQLACLYFSGFINQAVKVHTGSKISI